MSNPYLYTKVVNVSRLKKNIMESAIVHALDVVTLNGDALSITFKADLSAGDKTILDGVVAATDDAPLENAPEQRDSDGALITRTKITKSGRTYQSRYIQFTSSLKDSGVSRDYEDSQVSGEVSMSFFNANDDDISGLAQSVIDKTCVRTEIDINFDFVYDVFRARIAIKEETSEECRVFCRMAPSVPENLGGSKDMVHGLDVSFLTRKQWLMFDGASPKEIYGVPAPHFRVRIWHKPGQQVQFQTEWQLFK